MKLKVYAQWGNSRLERLIAWVLRFSPTVFMCTGRAPTLKEAWTGRVQADDLYIEHSRSVPNERSN